MRLRKVLIFLGVLFAAFMITQAPATSAEWVRDALTFLGNAIEGLFDFFGALAGV